MNIIEFLPQGLYSSVKGSISKWGKYFDRNVRWPKRDNEPVMLRSSENAERMCT